MSPLAPSQANARLDSPPRLPGGGRHPPGPRPIPLLWGYRGFWQIRLRWAVAPLMAIAGFVGVALGFEFEAVPIVAIAIASPLYNGVFAWLYSHWRERIAEDPRLDTMLTAAQVVADYAAMFLLIHFTGGSRSPLVPFLIFHVIIAAVQFRPVLAYLCAGWAAGGLWILLVAYSRGLLRRVDVRFHGESVLATPGDSALALGLVFFTITLFLSATLVGRIMERLRLRAAELADASARLERAMSERTRLMLQVAHNLRAPVDASLGQLDLLRGGYSGQLHPDQDARIHRVERRLRGLDATISELMAIAQARDWTREIADVVVDLGELAAYTESTFAGPAARAGVRLEVDAEANLPSLPSGASLLERMIDNLVSNAIKYTPHGGCVRVSLTRHDEDTVRIMVQDTGIGIPAAEQERLFEEFFRAANARKLTSQGSGLGLTFVRDCVERHGGTIFMASDEASGTTVVVDLPLHRPPLSELKAGSGAAT